MRAAAFAAADPPAITHRVDFKLGGAEDELDPLPRPDARDVVAAALEAEEPVARDHAGGALDDQIVAGRQRQQRRAITLAAECSRETPPKCRNVWR